MFVTHRMDLLSHYKMFYNRALGRRHTGSNYWLYLTFEWFTKYLLNYLKDLKKISHGWNLEKQPFLNSLQSRSPKLSKSIKSNSNFMMTNARKLRQ